MSTSHRAPSPSLRVALLALALLAGATRADVLHVPGEFPTVADAVAAVQPGDEIVLAAGTYDEVVSLVGLSGIVLRGQGKVLLAGDGTDTPPLLMAKCEGVTLEHLTVQDVAGDAVSVAGVLSCTLSRLRIEGGGGAGIAVGPADDLLVDRCKVEGVAGDGIALLGVTAATVSRCTVTGAGGAAISVSDSTGVVVDRCHVDAGVHQGIVLGKPDLASSCVARKNVVLLDSGFGIDARGADNVLIANRIVGGGLRLELGSTGGLAQGNKIIDCDDGILCFPDNVLLQDNRVVQPFDDGFICEGVGSVLIGNRVLHAGSSGFRFINSMTLGSVLACKALHAGEDGFLVDSDGVTFTDNTAKGSGGHGFRVTGSGNVFVGNSAKNNAAGSAVDEGSANVFLMNDFGAL